MCTLLITCTHKELFLKRSHLILRVVKKIKLAIQVQFYDTDPSSFETGKRNHIQRLPRTKNSQNRVFYGKLAVDFFATDQLLIPNTNLGIRLTRSKPDFVLATQVANSKFSVQIRRPSIFARCFTVPDHSFTSVHTSFQERLDKCRARYKCNEVKNKTFVTPAGQNQFVREDVFSSEPLR